MGEEHRKTVKVAAYKGVRVIMTDNICVCVCVCGRERDRERERERVSNY